MPHHDEPHFFADRTILGSRLKWWWTTHGLKTATAARELGVSTSTWGHWETGHTFPTGEMLLDISTFTKLPLQLLFCPHMDECPFTRPKIHHPATIRVATFQNGK
jgi:transcriptional regulator with XRE-family HTH domain